jgi:uncharacterized protein YjdB
MKYRLGALSAATLLACALVTGFSTLPEAHAASDQDEASVPAGMLTVTNENFVVQKGTSTYQLKVKASKASKKKLSYSSSNPKVATVSKDGHVKAKKVGTTSVTIANSAGVFTHATLKVINNSLSLNRKSTQIALDNPHVERIVYGHSVKGRNLDAYAISNKSAYKKTLFMDFAIHGFEDAYPHDGKVLTREANKLIAYFAAHPKTLKNW